MRIVDRYPATGFLNGARTLTVRSLPPGAQVTSFRLIVTPIADDSGAIGPAVETLSFDAGADVAVDPDDPTRQTGVSRTAGTGPPRWTEVAFNGFRTLSHVAGANLQNALLQVDVGGLFVAVDDNGTIPVQGAAYALSSNDTDLPGLSVRRMRLVAPNDGAAAPVVQTVSLRAVASNLTVAIGDQPAVWARPGDVTDAVQTGELAEFVQAALAGAKIENGFATLPLTIKTDTTARLAIEVAAEFDETAMGLPNGLPEVTLDYAHDATADAGDNLLAIAAPDGMELDPSRTRVEIAGTFEGSEISFGPLADRNPAASLALPEGHAAAAPVAVTVETVANAVDLLLSTQVRNASIQVDLREDFDGKPGDVSLLTKRASGALDVSRYAMAHWLSVALGQSITLAPTDPATGKPRIWVVVQAVAGTLDWHLNSADAATAQMQTSDNGGLSWRPARVQLVGGALAPGLRLRRASPVFRVPVRVEIGRGTAASELALDQFQPLGRVEFALDSNAVAGAVNTALSAQRATACPRGEQLRNGGFADRDDGEVYRPQDWTVSDGTLGRQFFTVMGMSTTETVRLIQVGDQEGPAQAVSQVIPVSPGCPYRLTFRGFTTHRDTRIELIWHGAECSVARVDTLDPPAPLFVDDPGHTSAFLATSPLRTIPAASLDTTAPEGADQVEVRVIAEGGSRIFTDVVSLTGGPAGIVNPDFRQFVMSGSDVEGLQGWANSPVEVTEENGYSGNVTLEGLTLTNLNPQGEPLILSQRIPVAAGAPFAAGLEGRVPTAHRNGPAPGFGAIWLDDAGTATGTPLAASVAAQGSEVTRLAATVPDGVAQAEIRIEIPSGAALTLLAVATETQAPLQVPVSFLSEAPGRLTVRDFTLGFRPAPAPPPPTFSTTPCAPTPADRAAGDVCEPDPCCGTDEKHAAPTTTVSALSATSVIDSLSQATIHIARAATPVRSLVHNLPLVSATARMAAITARRTLAGAGRRTLSGTLRERIGAGSGPNRPVADVNGVGDVRRAELATLGISTVHDLARADPDALVRQLAYSRRMARDLVARALKLSEAEPRS
ncbi:hypothetical protein [Yoonia sediminilitoris]|uniref:Helix-hairpin-helix protein n=1 Tax=Yoonia sediminilitoris TaxID=1286148 RepID=A0A2T6KC15_9RHOB|nr:hypothetical protein [Yoonia sediminilitoris]PUB12425.1 hypothetical protein C8N45_11064 [Yoonia sediminilitoris]RCW93119.1 hypothetical protein DFP92_11064 [Yoonia sediminilitoris]